MNPEGKSFNKLKSELSELLPYIDLKHADRANEIFDILDDAAAASEKAGRTSEWLGERAASHRNKEAHSRAARRPAKPLVRAWLRWL